MTRSERTRRFGLVLAYAAMSVWAQAGDWHGHGSAAEVACDAACRDPSPHYSGHPTPTLDRDASDCLACQGRANLLATLPEPPALEGRIVEPVHPAEPLAPTIRRIGVPSLRGPPAA